MNLSHYIKLMLCLVLSSGITGQLLVCQDVSSPSEDNLFCECENYYMFYDANKGKCEDICSFYGDSLCGYDANAKCVTDFEIPLNYACECREGYIDNIADSGVTCIDIGDQCADSPCSDPEVCVNLYGSFECVCKEFYYRDESGNCKEIYSCNLPNKYKCEQICNNGTNTGDDYCACYEGYTLNETDYRSCYLEEGNEDCTCDPNKSYCVYPTENELQVCEALPGYIKNGSGSEYLDINECDDGTAQCIQYSECVNLEGTYACDCFNDYVYNVTLKECKKRTCPPGSALYNPECHERTCPPGSVLYDPECHEFCGPELGPQCPYDTVCLVDDNNVPFCECQLACQIKGVINKTHSLYAYELNFTLGYENYPKKNPKNIFRITKSFESIFGIGNVQLLNYDQASIQMGIGLYTNLPEIEELRDIVSDMCFPLSTYSSTPICALPGNVVAIQTSFISSALYPCEQFPNLCENFTQCLDNKKHPSILPGSYECRCENGYNLADNLQEVYCIDIDECREQNINICPKDTVCVNTPGSYYCGNLYNNNYVTEIQNQLIKTQEDLDDQEHKTKVVGGVLGAVFALTFVLLVIALIYIAKMKS